MCDTKTHFTSATPSRFIADICFTYRRQDAAVRMCLLSITLPTQVGIAILFARSPDSTDTIHCHGQEYLRASAPSTMRVNDTYGSTAGLPQVLFAIQVIQYKKLSYRRGTARCVVSVEILPIAMQQSRNYLYEKS